MIYFPTRGDHSGQQSVDNRKIEPGSNLLILLVILLSGLPSAKIPCKRFLAHHFQNSGPWLSEALNLKWVASSRWTFRPNSALGSIRTTTIGKAHLTLLFRLLFVYHFLAFMVWGTAKNRIRKTWLSSRRVLILIESLLICHPIMKILLVQSYWSIPRKNDWFFENS